LRARAREIPSWSRSRDRAHVAHPSTEFLSGTLLKQLRSSLQAYARRVVGDSSPAQQNSEALRQQLEVALDRLEEGFIALDLEWRFTFVNHRAGELLGRSSKELIGRNVWSEFPEAVGGLSYHAHVRAMKEQHVVHIEVHDESRDRWYDNRIVPSQFGGSTFFQDVTERRRTDEQQLPILEAAIAAKRDAELANRKKTDYLAAISHELRTPLNAIAGHTQLLQLGIHGPVTPEQSEAFARIQRNEQHLLAIVNNVLNIAKLDGGGVEYHLSEVALAPLLDESLRMIEPQLRLKALTADVRVSSSTKVIADEDKLRQIVLNLLANAIKFTSPGGGVQIDATRGQQQRTREGESLPRAGAGPDVVFLRVSDTGIGVSRSVQDRIFDRFFQVATGPDGASGTGLGLAISREFARGMGGDLRVRSFGGAGSTFTVTLRAPGIDEDRSAT
jgi:PAS domain S-box-containing protein